jgi:outer membrane protein assembly factor BamB
MEVRAAASAGQAIPEQVLADRGFLQLWTKSPTEGAFLSAYFLPEGIFAVTRAAGNGTGYRLVRYNLETGLPLWSFAMEEPLRYPPAAYKYPIPGEPRRPDELYILQKDVIHCLDLQYGVALWKKRLPFSVSCAPVVDERQYYIGSMDRRVYAMGKDKEYVTWPYITGGEIKSPGTVGSSGQLYFTSEDKCVYRLEPDMGWVAGRSWKYETGGRILGSPVFYSRWLVVGSADFKFYNFEVDGTPAWQFPTESPIYGTPVVMSLRPEKALAFCISQDDRRGQEKKIAWCVDLKTGEKQWQKDPIDQVVTIGKKSVYLLSSPPERKLIAVDAVKGTEVTSLPVEGFDVIPTNDADHGTNPKQRGTIYLISKTGFMQAIQEKP